MKNPSPSESARRIRASLDRRNAVSRTTATATAAPPPLELAASVTAPLGQGVCPSPPDGPDPSDLGRCRFHSQIKNLRHRSIRTGWSPSFSAQSVRASIQAAAFLRFGSGWSRALLQA